MSESIEACREKLKALPCESFSNPGLALTRYLKRQKDKLDQSLLKGVAASRVSAPYVAAFQRWKTYQEADAMTVTFTGTLTTPLAIGLGSASATEVGLTVHHTYGMPMIPGTALKGLCRRGASKLQSEGKMTDAQIEVLFGEDQFEADKHRSAAGYVSFWDAWYDPPFEKAQPFKQDVVTIHHPDYYRNRGKEYWPTDFDDPTPIPFIVVKPDTRFFFALTVSSAEWGEFTGKLLRWSLENIGIGAKTNAGYGFFGTEDKWTLPPPRLLPIREEIWPECTITQKIEKGVTSATLAFGQIRKQLPQSKWDPLKRSLDDASKQQLKKRSIQAKVTVQIQGEEIEVLKIESV